MAQKKKKNNSLQAQKLAAAEYKKAFFLKFHELFNVFCDKDLYQLIPHAIFERIYEIRSHSMRPIPAKGNHIPAAILNRLKMSLPNFLKNESIDLVGSNTKINLYDMLTVGFTLMRFGMIMRDNEFAGADRIKKGLEKLRITDEFNISFWVSIANVLDGATFWYNDIGESLYWLKYDMIGFDNPSKGVQNIAYVYKHIPECIPVKINDIVRPAILLERVFTKIGAKSICITPSSLNIDGPFAEIPMKIYIQKHALQRLSERIDCLNIGFAQFWLYLSFNEPKVFYDNAKNLLIEYRISGLRAGYFRVDILEGIVLVRTFLFITNNGTPEGQLLEKNTGLQKSDKNYLIMDKLSTFITSDISNNKMLCKILDESGCHSLIELHENIKETVIKDGSHISDENLAHYLERDSWFEADVI
jgi:hypothetical protein